MADNRYYYFKDAKGNRHTVDKTAYDKDPMGFAKAFPGARMEVIDRKTGRRGDVNVKDASRVGDFGAHLFTGRTITRGKGKAKSEKSYSSALGRAQERVAQEKWGGGVVTHGNTTAYESASAPMENDSELVRGLKNANAVQRLQAPVSYTKPGAVKQMVKQTRERQHIVGQNVEQAGREFTNRERDRRNAPAFDLGNEDVNNNIVKTRGQLEGDMENSAASIANNDFADTFANMITSERQAAENRAMDAQKRALINSMPGASNPMTTLLLRTAAYNAERDPVKLQQNLSKNLEKNMESMLNDPNVAQKIVRESERLGVSPEDYVKTALMPAIQDKLMAEYDKSELQQWMPRNAFVDIIDGIGDGLRGGLLLDSILTKSQRQYRERAAMATQNDENPYYQRDKYGVTEGVRSAVSLASDATGPGGGIFGGIAKGVGKTSAKVFGNEVKTIANYANMTKLQRMFKPTVLLRGAAEGAANFGIYEGLKGAQSYSSTTDDVKLGEMLENSAVSAAHGAVSGATLGVVGKMLGGLGYNVGIKGSKGIDPNFGKNMLKGLGMKGMQVVGEGTAFYAGGNINNAISGQETDWSAGNLLSNIMAAGIYKIVSTHTATGAANMFAPEKGQSYGDSVAVKFGTALYKAAMAPSTQSKAFAFTPEEKSQLFVAGDKAGMPGREGYLGRPDILTWAGRVMKDIPVGKEDKSGNVRKVREYYSSVMRDPNVSWDAKMKLNALLGIAPATRPTMDYRTYTVEDGKRYVNEYAKDGVLLSKRSYKNMEQREAIEYDMIMLNENQRMLDGISYILNKDCEQTDLQTEFLKQHGYDFNNTDSPINQAIMDSMFGKSKNKEDRTLHDEWIDFVGKNGRTTKLIKEIAEAHGLSVEEMFKIVNEEPIKRTEEEQRACVELRKTLDDMVYEDGMPHEDQAERDGKDVVEENGLGTENPNNEAAAKVLFNMVNAEKAFQYALKNDDNLQQGYEYYKKAGLSNPQIYLKLMKDGYGNEVTLAPFADYINAKAKAVGMYRGTKQKIAETVQKHVEQWSYKGELNGEKQDGGQMVFVKDNKGRLLIVGAGDVAFDNDGRARESVGDMLSVLDAEKGEMDFVSVKDVKLERTVASEEYAKEYQELLEVKNSEVYAQNEQQKQMENAAGGVAPEGGKPEQPITEQGNAETTVQTGEANKPVPTFADGSPVPMTKDSKGRETADYSMMTPEQGVEWIEKTFGEDAEAVADGKIERAKKDLSKAEKMDIDMTADDADVLEAKTKKKAAIEAAQKELELYTNIKKAMVEKKVKATMEKVGSVGEVGSVGVAREKFENGLRVVGNKRTRTLADGTKIKGHYEIVEADSLTPSHNANDGYKKSEGFPVNEEGRTINDRDYENDKDAQRVTDMIAKNYDGQAVDQVPVVTTDGIVVDGNGRTMAGQKAAKDGTDGAYLEALKENAENYGFTAEQIEQSGIKHPRLVLVSDEPLPYDTATFAKFNKNEKKTQGNTQQTVAISKKLGIDEISAIVAEIEGSGSLDAFFNNPTAINSLLKRLIDKGVIGLNEVAGLREGENKLSASGKDFVRNLLLGSVFSEDTIRMMGADAGLKSKALNGIRAVLDNMKLGDYALRGEIDKAVQLVYEARQQGGDVDAYLRTPAMFGENAADRYDPISQAIALALDGKAEDFRDLMMAYNRNAAHYADANQLDVYGDRPTKEEFINEFLKLRNWKNYETRHSSKEGNGDAGSSEGGEPETSGGNGRRRKEGLAKSGDKTLERKNIGDVFTEENGGPLEEDKEGKPGNDNGGSPDRDVQATEGQRQVDKAVKRIATEITKKTGIEVVTDEKEAEEVIRESEETDSDLKYHKETDEATLEELENGETVKVYRAMQVIDGKLYPPMAAAVNGKRVEANELGVWIRADENPDLAIPDIDPKTKEQKVDKKTGELKWKFKLDKGGKDATGKKATDIPAAYNPYWHTSRSPLNDQFKSAWIRPNIVVVECEVPVSELSSGYRAERAKDAVGEVDWKSGVVSGEVYKQTGRARKVILSRWCKPVRVLSDAEVAQRAKEFVGDAKVEIPENVLTPRQRIEFEKAGFKIGAPEKGVKKSDQILEALKRGLQIDNEIKEHRSRWAGGEVVGMKQLPDKLHTDPDMLWNEISQYHGDYITRKLEKVPEDGTVKFFSAHDGKWYFYSVDKNHTITLFDAVEASRENYELFKDKLKKYGFDGTTKAVREDMQETGYTGRTNSDKLESFIRPGLERGDRLGNGRSWRESGADRRGMAGETDGTQLEGNSEKQGEVKYFRTANGEVYGFTDGEKIYLDTKKMKPETPLHEYAHLWCDMLRKVNPKEWENVKKLFDKVEGLKEEVQKLYPELEGDALYEEMITTYSGREGTKKLEDVVRKLAAEEGKSVTESAKAQGFLEKVKVALTKYWKGVADVLGIHFTTAEEVADKVLADWAKGVDPRGSEKGKEKSEESDSKVEGEEPPKTNPLAWLAHTAEMFKDEQIQKARKELTAAKESGDASDIKRATEKMKQAMETKLRGNGIGLVERRRIIVREIGKILGEEVGKAEAEKIDKPWEQMDLEEREAVSSKNPLTETEINELTSEENRELIPAALAYLRGDKGNIINAISYFKIWNDVRSRHENVPDNSGTKDGTQLDAPNTGGSQELGLGRGREGGGPDGPVDRTDSERTAPGERESGTGGENNTTVSAGKPSVDKGEGNTPGMDAVSAGSTDTRGGGRPGNEGNVPKRGGQGGGNGPLDPNAGRKPAAKQGTHFPNSTSERLKQERAEYEQKKKDFWERWKKAGQGYVKIALTPFKALNLSPEQIEMLPELFKMHLNGAVLKIKEGIYKFNEWKAAMRAEEGEELKMIGLSDDDIDRFIEDYWNTPYQMDGETHTIGEWAGIHGNENLRNKLSEPLNEKYQRQVDAEPIKVKVGDMKNIEETLPYLLPQQQEDVLKAETQFFGKEHTDREHAYGKGYMFTNGTGTGKTFTGLGIAKRLVKQGKGRILIVTPSQKKVSDWIKDGRNLNMEIRDLDSWAKDRGTTATTESGEGVVITTFANFGVNKKLLEENWDAVIYDESHRIMENKKGTETARSMQHYMVTNRDENHCFLRLQEINKDYQKMKSLGERFDAERDKEVKRIQDEYKASHPSATARDVAYATSKMLPKEINGFTPGDYASFPKLGEIHAEFVNALRHYTNEVKSKLEAQAKNEWKDTKTIFLSATPFNTRENLDYVEGYIFKYPEGEKGGRMSGRTQFYLDHFGAAYKFRYGRLEQSTSNPEAVAKQEIAFSDYLQHTLGTMSGRIIDSPYDYSRDFPTVSPDHAEQFNQAVQDAVRGHGVLADAYRRTIGDYNYGSALFETMKVANIIERIKAHLDAGRKVVIFHRRVETKEPLKPPFALMLEQANHLVSIMGEGEEKKEAAKAVRDFRKKYADLLKWEQTLDYSMPREQIAKVFGKDNVLFFSGKESSKVKDKAVDTFNDDNSGKNIIVIQEASGKEGISLHDKTGKHQRVCITLALPQSPITALQIEGRTYRIGNKSNAIFEYPILGLNSEMMLFGQKFNNQVSTTENLALGSQARSLRDSFANGILEHSGVVPIDQQGVGGKEFDAPKDQSTDGFDNAVLDYYSNQKLNSRNREGVDYFPTPEPLGYKMMEWANMGEGDTVMEPSAGHGAIARYAPKGNQMVAIEPSQSLFAKLQLKAGGLGRKFVNTIFENYDISNKHDVVVMNPPFGTAGATAIAHLGKAFKHLEEGGRVVAIIPRGSTDKKFEKWINGEKTAVMRAEVELPDIVFKQAGTNVVCRVVVVDKISNEAMRAKAGSVEKVNLGGHYDKIEDFFEDLRDIEMPDRIIDTNTIMQKKSKQTAKDLKELKDVTVNLNEHGINVHVRGDRNDYSIMFDLGEYNAEQRKSILSGTYERFEEYERYTRDETSQAVIAELKKLSCKLAGMTEEEMQRYLKKQNDGKGVMYRVEHAAEVYNKAKGGSKGQRDGRVVPEDVDKKTSEGIEKKFDEEIGEIESDFDSKEEFMQAVSREIHLASRYRKSVLENQKKQLENELRRKESNTGEDSERVGTGRLTSVNADNKTTLQGHRDKVRGRIALAAINRELDYRRVRAENLRNTYGLSAGSEIGFGEVEKIFRQLHTSPELGKLFAQTRDVLKRLGVDFGIQDEINSGKLTSPMGYASPERDIRYSIDGLVKTSSSKAELPVTILHEMIHEGVNGAIHLVKSGKADGMLTPKQIEAVETISEIYDRAVGNQEKFGENKYGLANEYEFAAQMADPRQRKALDLGVMDRVVNFAKELMRKGDRSVWERVKDAVKKLFEVSDKSKMDKAIEDILEDFNKTVDDAAMVDVDENGWSYDKGVVTPEKTSGTSNAMSERIIKTVEKVAKRTGGKVKMVNSVEEIENPKVRKDIENGKQVTGWYDEKTGEVHLYMPNIHDTYTAEKTVWHETVGHKGMRGLLGDKFDSYMRDLWMDLDNPINAELRAYVKEKMNMNHLGFYDAIEEFIAKSAEDGKGEPGFWNYLKNKVTDALHEIGYRVSPNVKDVKYMLWLAKNVQKHGDSPLWKMRAEAVRWKIEHEKTLSVVEENGMMYDNNGKKHGLLDLNKKDFDEATDGHVHYRTSPMTASKIEEYNRRLSTKWYAFKESTVDDMQSLQEAMQIISGVKDAYADIPSAFNPLQCHNRMGSMVMQMCERYDREYTEPLGDAFKKVVSAMPGKDGAEQTRNANLYFIKKHGLERNRVLFVRDWVREKRKVESEKSKADAMEAAWKNKKSDLRQKLESGQIDLKEYYRQMDEWIVTNLDKDFKAEEHDYSGMHGIYDVKKGEVYDDANVIDEVMSTESQLGADLVKSFWDAKKKATDFTIDQVYANGFMDKNGRDHLKEMFDWYVPLRKFDDTVAEDVYGYISGGDTKNGIGSVIEKARGRESLSDVNVLAQISALAKSSILNGGKNVERQHFMRFVEAYEKGDAKDRIFVEIQPWVEKHTVDGNEVWKEVMPNIPENSTQEQITDILNTFEADMKAKQANGEAKIARKKSDIGYKFERSSDMNQHIVNVYVNGRVRRFVCQGNPRAAQAINGLLRDSGTRGWVSEKSAKLNRYCAQLNTSLNPDFLSSNLMRDLTFASANLTKEGMGYTWDFCMEYAKNWASMARRKDGNFDGGYLGMFRRYKDGRLNTNNHKERWFKEFMDNGGETGFVSLKKYEDIIKEYDNLVKTGNKEGDRWLMKKLKEGGAFIELANEVVENVARYSTYCVSRKRGRSIGKSIYDAKEVSSNFNRHGSGDAIKSLKTEYDGKTDAAFRGSVGWFNSWMKNHTMFYNAGVQGANLFTKNLKHAPKTFAIAFGAMPFGLNIAVALVNQLLISQEDEKKRNGVKNPYAELPEWKRRNNLCIYWGGGKFKTIPMGIELRAFYGLGDIAAGYMVDESLKSDTPIGLDIIGQMAQLVPASDFLGHHSPSSGIKELGEDVALSVIPTIAKPEFELAFNRDWTGRPIYRDKDYLDRAPRWKRAYDSTNDAYMTINKWANKTFNGIDSTNEDLKGSGMMADAVDFFTAPYGLQHIVEGYTGGTGATIGRMYQTGKSFAKGVVSGIKDDKGFAEGFNKEWDKVDPNTIPFYRVFNYTPKEGNDMQRTKSKWYNYADELEQLKYNMQQMKTNTPDTAKNIHNAATKFKFSQSKEGRKLKIYEAADRYITAKRRILKRAKDKTVVEAVNAAINRKMQEAVEDLDRIE